ncbi:rCG62134 [Rattus norvegicus]|uniref:RCG62134 n=1 Tax=Rattus norvegicus TaxID=10116 RepID=A6HAS5_RAT|nr:rCG62134 [Rattus norvegicus]
MLSPGSRSLSGLLLTPESLSSPWRIQMIHTKNNIIDRITVENRELYPQEG